MSTTDIAILALCMVSAVCSIFSIMAALDRLVGP